MVQVKLMIEINRSVAWFQFIIFIVIALYIIILITLSQPSVQDIIQDDSLEKSDVRTIYSIQAQILIFPAALAITMPDLFVRKFINWRNESN